MVFIKHVLSAKFVKFKICTSIVLSYSIYANIYVGFAAPTNVMATVVTLHSIEVTWNQSPNITGYLVSYTTTASYTSGGSVTVNGGSTTSTVLTNLEENTLYAITVQATSSDNRMSVNSSEVSVITYADGK